MAYVPTTELFSELDTAVDLSNLGLTFYVVLSGALTCAWLIGLGLSALWVRIGVLSPRSSRVSYLP